MKRLFILIVFASELMLTAQAQEIRSGSTPLIQPNAGLSPQSSQLSSGDNPSKKAYYKSLIDNCATNNDGDTYLDCINNVLKNPGYVPVVHGKDTAVSQNLHGNDTQVSDDCPSHPLMLESDSPNSLGWTWQQGDAQFMDINVSLQSPLFYNTFTNADSPIGRWLNPEGCRGKHIFLLGFDMRAGFYVDTRHSSPFITKSLNPRLTFRNYLSDSNISNRANPESQYIDLEYGHWSNGQTVDSLAAYNNEVEQHIIYGENPKFSNDYISEGWDYLQLKVRLTYDPSCHPGHFDFPATNDSKQKDCLSDKTDHDYQVFNFGIRRYIGGFLQQHIEEDDPWEANVFGLRTITHLNQVNGINISDTINMTNTVVNSLKITYDTGLYQPTQFNSIRLDAEISCLSSMMGIPVGLWYSSGYMNNLAVYFQHASAFGINMDFTTLIDPFFNSDAHKNQHLGRGCFLFN